MHSLDFKEKLLEKGKRETAEGLSRKLKVCRRCCIVPELM